MKIKKEIQRTVVLTHPFSNDLAFLYGVIVVGNHFQTHFIY